MKTVIFVATFCVALSYGISVAKEMAKQEQDRTNQMVAMVYGGVR